MGGDEAKRTRSRRGHGEGTISKRRDGRWEARVDLGWMDGKRVRRTFYGSTRNEVAASSGRPSSWTTVKPSCPTPRSGSGSSWTGGSTG